MTRRFFSGSTLDQAVMMAARHYEIDPQELVYRQIEKRHGFLKTRKAVMIAVDPERPRREPEGGGDTSPVESTAPMAVEPEGTAGPSDIALESPGEPGVGAQGERDEAEQWATDEPSGQEETEAWAADDDGESEGGSDTSPVESAAPMAIEPEGTAGPSDTALESPGEPAVGAQEEHDEAEQRATDEPSGQEEAEAWAADDDGESERLAAEGHEASEEPERAAPEPEERQAEPSDLEGDDELLEAAERASHVLLRFAGIDAVATARAGAERIEVEIEGPDESVLVVEGGKGLLSIQHLLPRMLRGQTGRSSFVRADSKGFHQQRKERLEALALKEADAASRSASPRTLPPMAPDERRIVHLALKDSLTVVTESRGTGLHKRVVIRPADGFDEPGDIEARHGF